MKITGTSSYIRVQINDRTVRIDGEMMVGGFLAYSDSIKKWEPPYEHEKIDDQMKQGIVEAVLNETQNSPFKIVFES